MRRSAGSIPDVTFRSLRERDLPVLHDWIQRPHVAQWWGGGGPGESLEDTTKKYLPRLHDGSIKPYFALLASEPIGFIQSYIAIECGHGWWADETDPGVYGTDQFLCNPNQLGKGLGTTMVTAFVRHLFHDPKATRVQTDPDPGNARAIRCYEKAGFRRIGNVATPNGQALLMVIARESFDACDTACDTGRSSR